MKTRIILFLLSLFLFARPAVAQEILDSISMQWWAGLDDQWQKYFIDKDSLTKPIDGADLDSIRKKSGYIDLRGYVIYDLNPLQALSGNLAYLICSRSFISSFEPLRGMKKLTTLICDSVSTLRSIEPLLGISSLTAMRFIKTNIPNDELKKLRATRKDIAIMLK